MTMMSRNRPIADVLAIVASLAPAAPSLGAADWVFRGPTGGSIYSIAPRPTDATTVLAGTAYGGVARSTDAGATWKQTAPTEVTSCTVAAVTWDATGSTAYAATSSCSAYAWRSRDLGATWEPLFTTNQDFMAGGECISVTVSRSSPRTVLFTCNIGVFLSLDGGATAEKRSTGLERVVNWRGNGISADGVTFFQASLEGLFSSSNQGKTWELTLSIPSDRYWWIDDLATSPADPDSVFVRAMTKTTSQMVLLWSRNRGASFTNVGSPFDFTSTAVDPIGRVFVSDDDFFDPQTGSWKRLQLGRRGGIHFSYAVTREELFIGTATGTYRKSLATGLGSDGAFSHGFTLMRSMIRTGDGFAVGSEYRGVWRSTDRGSTLGASFPSDADPRVNRLFRWPAGSSSLIAGTNTQKLFMTRDGGATWSAFGSELPSTCSRYQMAEGRNGSLVVGVDRELYSRSSIETPFTPLRSPVDDAIYRVASAQNGRTLYAEGTNTDSWISFLSRSTDGSAWSRVQDPGPCGYSMSLVVDPRDDRTLYRVCRWNYDLWKSADEGATWDPVRTWSGSTLTAKWVTGIFLEDRPPYRMVGRSYDGTLYLSTDRMTWTPLPPLPVSAVDSILFDQSRIVAATSSGIYTLDLAGSSPVDPATTLPLIGGQVAVTVTWRSQYSGDHGTALPLPQQDGFGYFSFFSASNPEVFVKVLDLPSQDAFWVFYAGLTDLEYTVTFTNRATETSIAFRKPAGSFTGGADTWSLKKR